MTVSYPGRHGDAVLFPRCTVCREWRWPSGEVCGRCGRMTLAPAAWSGVARVVSEVVVHRGVPERFLRDGAYRLVKLDLGGFDFITHWAARPAEVLPGQRCALRWGEIDSRLWPLAVVVDTS